MSAAFEIIKEQTEWRDKRIADLEAAIRKYGNEWYADLLDENKLNQARRDMFALVRK